MKTTHILDNTLMPCEGFYRLQRITADTFADLVSPSFYENQICVHTPELLSLTEKLTGLKLQVCLELPAQLEDGDKLLVVKQTEKETELYSADFISTPPLLPYSNLIDIDIYEPAGQRFIRALYLLTGGRNLDAIEYTLKLMKELDESEHARWKELHSDYLELLQMHFDPEGYRKSQLS